MIRHAEHSVPICWILRKETLQDFISSLGKGEIPRTADHEMPVSISYTSFDEMTTLSRDFRTALSQIARISRPHIVKVQESKDKTKKTLLRLEDGRFIESVLIQEKQLDDLRIHPGRMRHGL